MTEFGKYRAIDEKAIGKGTFGKVFAVQTEGVNALYALKRVDLSTCNPKDREHLRQEVEMLQRFEHDNLVKYQDSFSEDKFLCIVMEYCHKGNLRQYLSKLDEVDECRFLAIFKQVCQGIKCLHDAGVMHRDIKTTNIFISEHDVVKIGDFGLARVMPPSASAAITRGVGTPSVMSPEMMRREEYSFKADIWNLGCCMCEVAWKEPLFSGKNVEEISKQREALSRIDLKYCRPMNDFVHALLNKDPAERPSIDVVLQFLHSHQHDEASDSSGYCTESATRYTVRHLPVYLTDMQIDYLEKSENLEKEISLKLNCDVTKMRRVNSALERTKCMENDGVFMEKLQNILEAGELERCRIDLKSYWLYKRELLNATFKMSAKKTGKHTKQS